ncbi:DNA repair protein RecO [Wolbachia pipientis]|uniref:DNA repair protein RecO n=1 Tax=Wolbachia pipientis TaxID=955 RepID=A0A1E7QJR7_WOLPI|nr:DNA repair protein RecO [Wolbachia pipientis]OEY86718.1 DNA repair protein RecO [Wolbachia pipientis]
MKWRDEGIIISTKKHGDKNLIISLFTQNHGRRKGLAKLVSNKFQISNLLDVEWNARLPENLGFFKCELIESPLHHFFHNRLKNIAIISFASILEKVLPEGESYSLLYGHFLHFIHIMKQDNEMWQGHYIDLELSLLTQLGFNLDLSKCAVTGTTENLKFISPKTGRAVSTAVGISYADKLFPFPQILYDIYNHNIQNSYSYSEFQSGLKITGYFLNKYLLLQLSVKLPEARSLMLTETFCSF